MKLGGDAGEHIKKAKYLHYWFFPILFFYLHNLKYTSYREKGSKMQPLLQLICKWKVLIKI